MRTLASIADNESSPIATTEVIASAHGHAEVSNADHHLQHEALTMGLYVSITLLAALSVTPGEVSSDLETLALVWGTTVGLAMAHWFAYGLASKLKDPVKDAREITGQLIAQLTPGFVVAFIASVPVLLLPEDLNRTGARFATAGCIGFTAYAEVRAYGGSRRRATVVALVGLVLALVVAALKYLLTH